MTTREENFMSMARAVANTVGKYKGDLAGLVRFTNYAASLDGTIAHIDSKQVQAEIMSILLIQKWMGC